MRLLEDKGQGAASRQHVAVMVDEVVALVRALNLTAAVDVTVGTGGHAEALLQLGTVRLLGIDRDQAALDRARVRLADYGPRVILRQGDFRDLDQILDEAELPRVNLILADLGMSSFALDDAARGFSFRLDGPLDMRMDREQALRAGDLINEEAEAELAHIIYAYGEERASRRIARAIVAARRRRPILTTGELAAVIEGAVGSRSGGRHSATRTFQALRIAVNHELESLATLLDRAPARLNAGGRLIVLAYHSLEDRPVKERFRELARLQSFRSVTRKALRPTAAEAARNPRARSARLRCLERVSQ